jgi:hypothetical protein
MRDMKIQCGYCRFSCKHLGDNLMQILMWLIKENITRHLAGISLIAPSSLPINHVTWASIDNDIVQIINRVDARLSGSLS